MLIIDRRHEAMGGQPHNRPVSQLTQIALHWSGALSNIWNHEDWWKNGRGWRMGGYHFWIDRQGNIYQNYNYTVQTNGVSGENVRTVHVCVESNSLANYTSAQEQARDWLIKKIMDDLNIKADNVRGHGEWPNQTTVCPGYSKSYMDALRESLANGQSVAMPPVKIPVAPSGSGKLEVNGVFFGNIDLVKELQAHFNTPITGNISPIGQPSMLITAMQRFYGSSPVSGNVSRPGSDSALWEAMQKYHGTEVTKRIGERDSMLIKRIQEELNAGTYPRRASAPVLVAPKPAPKPAPVPSGPNLAVNGRFFGNAATIRALQRHFGTSQTGAISDPPARSLLIEAMQRFYGSPVTGQVSRGDNTSLLWTAMQRYHGTSVTGKISPSGSLLIQAVQRQLNNGTYPRRG